MVCRQESCSLKVNTRSVITMISPINMFVSERINATLTRLNMESILELFQSADTGSG